MNLNLNSDQLFKLVTDEIDSDAFCYDGVRIEDEDELHDYILTIRVGGIYIEDYDYLYYNAVALIPQIIDDVIDYIEDMSYDVRAEDMRTYYSLIAF